MVGDNNRPGAYVINDRFESCQGIGHTGWRLVRMAEVNVGWPPAIGDAYDQPESVIPAGAAGRSTV